MLVPGSECIVHWTIEPFLNFWAFYWLGDRMHSVLYPYQKFTLFVVRDITKEASMKSWWRINYNQLHSVCNIFSALYSVVEVINIATCWGVAFVIFYWGILGIQYYVAFRCTTQWFENYILMVDKVHCLCFTNSPFSRTGGYHYSEHRKFGINWGSHWQGTYPMDRSIQITKMRGLLQDAEGIGMKGVKTFVRHDLGLESQPLWYMKVHLWATVCSLSSWALP